MGAAPEEAVNELKLAITQHKPVLAIIDPLLKLVRVTNANDYAEVCRVLEPLIELARTSGCHLLCVHHLGKGERIGADALLGSTALFAAVDTLLLMQRHDQIRTIATNSTIWGGSARDGRGIRYREGLVSLGGNLTQVQVETYAREVLREVSSEERTETQIKEAVGKEIEPPWPRRFDTSLKVANSRRMEEAEKVIRFGIVCLEVLTRSSGDPRMGILLD